MDPVELALRNDLIQDAWAKGDLYYKLQDHQLDIYHFLRTRQSLTCFLLLSRRYGKTHISFIVDVEDCLRTPNSRIGYFYPTLKQGKQIIFPIAEIVFEDAPAGFSGIWSELESCYVFPNQSKIYIFGCDSMRDIDRHRGPKYSSIRIDETGVHPYLNYLYKSVLLPTLLTMKTKPLIAFMGTPAPSIEHESKMIYEQAVQKGDAIRKTIMDNDSIDTQTREDFILESGGYDSTETRREYFCEWVTDSELAVIPEWRDDFIQEVERTEYYQFYDIYCVMDVGGRDKTAIGWFYYDFKKGQLIQEYESILTGQETTVQRIAEEIKAIENEHYKDKKIRRWADNNAVILLQDLSINHQIGFNPTSKDLKLAMVSEVRTFVNQGRLLIHPRCIETAGCLRSAVWEKNRSEYQRSSLYGHFDALDVVVYTIRNLDTHSNPIPWDYKVDKTNIHAYDRLRHNTRNDSIKRAFKK